MMRAAKQEDSVLGRCSELIIYQALTRANGQRETGERETLRDAVYAFFEFEGRTTFTESMLSKDHSGLCDWFAC